MLELAGVRHRYDGRVVLDIARFAVSPGAGVAIVDPNGSGKSTLLRLLALLERPSEGEVRLGGAVVAGGKAARAGAGVRRRITLVEQRPVLLRGTVRENLEFGLQVRGIRRSEVNRKVEGVAARLGIASLLHRRRHELSDGEVQRVAVARALAVEPDVLLLDEPASSADRAAAQTLYRALTEERARRPLAASARNVFTGRVPRLTHQRPGAVLVTADVGVELVAVVTEEAARDLGLTPGGPVVFSFKATAVRVF